MDKPYDRLDFKWLAIVDPTNDFKGGLFRKTDIAQSAKSKIWASGTIWRHVDKPLLLICAKNKLIEMPI